MHLEGFFSIMLWPGSKNKVLCKTKIQKERNNSSILHLFNSKDQLDFFSSMKYQEMFRESKVNALKAEKSCDSLKKTFTDIKGKYSH